MMASLVTVLLVDDHAVVREGYRRLLERDAKIQVVGEAANSVQAYERSLALDPEVVVMDIALPGVSGIEAMRRILSRRPQQGVLMFSMHDDAHLPLPCARSRRTRLCHEGECARSARRCDFRGRAWRALPQSRRAKNHGAPHRVTGEIARQHADRPGIRGATAAGSRRHREAHRRETGVIRKDRREPPVCHSRKARRQKWSAARTVAAELGLSL